MHIFLDTTVFRADFHLASPDAKLLGQFLHTTRSVLAVPIVVIEEAKNLFYEELSKGKNELDKVTRLLNSPQVIAIDIGSEASKYEVNLVERLKRVFRAKLLNYPTVSHEEIIRRDLGRRRPFTKSGKGYRDTLIWHSILQQIKDIKDEFVFITNNTSDFWNEAGIDLHDELRSDISQLGGIVGPFKVFRNLAEFNNEIVKPKLVKINAIFTQLQKGKFPYLSVRKIATDLERDVTDNLDFRDALRHIHWEYSVSTEDVQVLDFGRVSNSDDIEIIEVLEMPNADLFIRFSAEYAICVTLNVPAVVAGKWEDAGFSLDSKLQGEDVLMSIDLPIRAEFTLIYDTARRKLDSYEISAEFA